MANSVSGDKLENILWELAPCLDWDNNCITAIAISHELTIDLSIAVLTNHPEFDPAKVTATLPMVMMIRLIFPRITSLSSKYFEIEVERDPPEDFSLGEMCKVIRLKNGYQVIGYTMELLVQSDLPRLEKLPS